MLLAIGLGVAGYSYVLTLRRGPLHSIDALEPIAEATQLEAPGRLPADPEARRRALPASVAVNPEERVPVRITLQNVPDFLAGEQPGIALFSAETGADFDWIPLSTCRDGVHLETSTPIVGPVAITIARDRASARHGYLVRTTHTFSARRGSSEPLKFDVQSYRVALAVGDHREAGPIRLTRANEPDWQSSGSAPTGVSCQPGTPTTLALGPGEYELTDPIDPTRNQRFTVPSTAMVQISDSLSRPLAGHL